MASSLSDMSGQTALAGEAAWGNGMLEDFDDLSAKWYFSREEIEKYSPSRLDGIDMEKETYLRQSYCTFLQDLGMHLKVPQVTIATAIVYCHRFFQRQSHKRNDRYTIATVCMFLAGKVEETPRPVREVILYSHRIRFRKDPAARERIKVKEIMEEQKELVLAGAHLVLTTLDFDMIIHHPYEPLLAAIKKFGVAKGTLAEAAWNIVNDGLRTSLCLQFRPHHIAAGAIFLAAKLVKVDLPKEGDKVWWQEFHVTPRQLREVCSSESVCNMENLDSAWRATSSHGGRHMKKALKVERSFSYDVDWRFARKVEKERRPSNHSKRAPKLPRPFESKVETGNMSWNRMRGPRSQRYRYMDSQSSRMRKEADMMASNDTRSFRFQPGLEHHFAKPDLKRKASHSPFQRAMHFAHDFVHKLVHREGRHGHW